MRMMQKGIEGSCKVIKWS